MCLCQHIHLKALPSRVSIRAVVFKQDTEVQQHLPENGCSCIPCRETLFLIKLFNKYFRSLENSLNLKGNSVYTQEQRRPLQLVVEDLIGVIIYHVNPKVFLN